MAKRRYIYLLTFGAMLFWSIGVLFSSFAPHLKHPEIRENINRDDDNDSRRTPETLPPVAAVVVATSAVLFVRFKSNGGGGSNSMNSFCSNTKQGPRLVTDDQGYTCPLEKVSTETSCCPRSAERYSCVGCTTQHCCEHYEYCVSCCMSPSSNNSNNASKKPTAASKRLFAACVTACRTSSESLALLSDRYQSDTHHYCFVRRITLAPESKPNIVS